MIPLIPTLALSILSLFSSGFVILHAIAPLIPNSRVHPRKRSWTAKECLPMTGIAHLWLTISDVISLAIFVWEVFAENLAGPADIFRAASSARFLTVLSIRQTCLLFTVISILFSTRRAKYPSFGPFQWVLWTPALVVTAISAAIAGITAHFGVVSFSIGAPCFSISIALLCTITITGLFSTLNAIRGNLATLEKDIPWRSNVDEEKERPFLSPQDIEALKEGSSWITSNPSSQRDSVWSFSFDSSTVGTSRTVPALGEPSIDSLHDSSWLTEPTNPPPTMPDWSFPTSTRSRVPPDTMDIHTRLHPSHACSCPITPALSSAQFLGEYSNKNTGKLNLWIGRGISNTSLYTPKSLEICWMRIIAWLVFIWVPLVFSLPYLFVTTSNGPSPILFILSVTLSAPMLAFNAIFYPLPVPDDLFGDTSNLPKPSDIESGHKRSGSMTVVEGRRSVDVWLHKGDAFDGKNKLSRATSMLSRVPKLSLLPVNSEVDQKCNGIEPTVPHSAPQDSSMATSAFVAIEAFGYEDVTPTSRSIEGADDDLPSELSDILPSALSQVDISPVPSRRSSTSSRSSKGSRTQREPFTSNLETIPDIDMHTPQKYTHYNPPCSGVQTTGSYIVEPKTEELSTPGNHYNTPQEPATPQASSEGITQSVDRGFSSRIPPVQSTPETDHRLGGPLSFSSPDLTSTPLLVSLSYGDVEGRGHHRRIQDPIMRSEALQSDTSRTNVATAGEHDHDEAEFFNESKLITTANKPDININATDVRTNRRNLTSRIPKRTQALIQSNIVIPNSVNHLSQASLSSTSLTTGAVDSSKQRETSLIPLPTRLREVDVIYEREFGIHSSHTPEWPPYKLNNNTSEVRPKYIASPMRLVRSASDKRGILLRNRRS